ncbi:MAG: hypothetical protein AAGB51_13120 [Planctomycetota bacterium]
MFTSMLALTAAAITAGAVDDQAYTESSIETLPDGVIVIDDLHRVTGSGTEEDPYVTDWQLLMSASRVYKPKDDKLELPGWVKLFEGKRVKVQGFLAAPLFGGETDEILSMLNQWDGCCIGVPPTPYDAIEVKLSEPVPVFGLHASPTGTVVGVFRTDPYVVNDWLVGLYLMEDAVVDVEGF